MAHSLIYLAPISIALEKVLGTLRSPKSIQNRVQTEPDCLGLNPRSTTYYPNGYLDKILASLVPQFPHL